MKRLFSIAIAASLLCSMGFAQDVAAKRSAAEQGALTWLLLVDRGDYGQSWQEAASFFQSKISNQDWQNALKQTRTPLGKASNRTLLGSQYQTDVPGAPKGDYVIIQYKTVFAGGTMIETVTPMIDKDGKWRVSGYFIRPAQ
jgi:hypothetical protein